MYTRSWDVNNHHSGKMREPTSGVSFDEQLDEQGPRTKQQTSKHMESHDDNVVSRTKVSGSGFQAVKNRFNGHGDEEEEVNVEKPEWNVSPVLQRTQGLRE